MNKGEDGRLARPEGAFTVPYILGMLHRRGLVSRADAEDVAARAGRIESVIRQQKERERAGWQTQAHGVSPVEVLAAVELTTPQGEPLDEDRINEELARETGFTYEKIDPLKLDARLITNTLSRPFARRHIVLPLRELRDQMTVAVENPFDIELIDTLRTLMGESVEVVLSSRTDILKLITEIYGFRSSLSAAEKDLTSGPDLGNLEQFVRLKSVEEIEATDKHVINAVDYILRYAFEQRASDIHIEPKRAHSTVRMRIDGVLHEVHRIPRAVHPAIVSRLKTMGRMDIAEKRKPQDGRVKTEWTGKEVELRLSSMPVAFGEKLVIRVFEPGHLMKDLPDLGLDARELALYDTWIRSPNGIILVCGPTGSGKTTTLYSTLLEIATPEVNATTIEDPIEMVVEAFNQTAVHPRAGITFASALRTLLRQDPDIVMVGEIRDLDTAENAIQAALTGHLVLSTLHTVDSPSAVTRLLDFGVPPYLVSSTLTGVISQRLVRKVCEACARPVELSLTQYRSLSIRPNEDHDASSVREGAGCSRCRGTGFLGRAGVFELMPGDEQLRKLILERTPTNRLRRAAVEAGMRTLRESAIRKLFQGITSYDEVLRVTAELQ